MKEYNENNLEKLYPEISKEWHPTKNGDLTPRDVTASSGKKVWWKCKEGHEWETVVYSRTKNKTNCPYCTNQKILEGYNDLASLRPDIAKDWHPTKNKNLKPSEVGANSTKKVWWICDKGHEWESVVNNRTKHNGTGCPYCANQKVLEGYNDLATLRPEVAKDWHPTKNGDLTPTQISEKSNKKVWWMCENGHEWDTTVNGKGMCPYCSNQKVLEGFNDLATTHPDMAEEWHPTKNGDLKPSMIVSGSNKKVWWMCKHGHEWKTTPNSKAGCPYCSKQKILKGFNDLATTHPEIAREWHPVKNKKLSNEVTSGSSNKVWWICDKGHEWEAVINSRTTENGSGCPYCSGRFAIIGETDLYTLKPEIAKDWHPTKNGNLTPKDVTSSSGKKVWWICDKGHEWNTSVYTRTCNEKSGCPYCSNKKVLKGYNDLATTHPEISKEWHPTKNKNLTPFKVVSGSNKKVWWMCEHGHEWKTAVSHRTFGKTKCPYCTNHKVLKGYNDLATTHPEVAKEWHPTKNEALNPDDITAGSSQKVWWVCNKGHEWKSAVSNRARTNGTGCPECSKYRKISFAEKSIYFYIKSIFPDALENFKNENFNNFELDIYIPSLKLAIEYDGQRYHTLKTKKRDEEKNELCERNGVFLIRVREKECPTLKNNQNVFIIKRKAFDSESLNKSIEEIIEFIFEKFNITKSIDVKNKINVDSHSVEILNIMNFSELKNSLEHSYPEVAREWHPTKNGNLTPSLVSKGSNALVWWKCEKGHEWKVPVKHRVKEGKIRRCPYCYGNLPIPGETDLATTHPDLIKEWDFDKNKDISPKDITYGSGKKVWWKCKKGHEWKTSINSRTSGNNCPYCSNKKIIKGYNDLATTHPEIAKEWHPTKNGDLKPADVVYTSHARVWWKCTKGHEWQTSVGNRAGINKQTSCPYCTNQKVLEGYNDLASLRPDIAKDWHPTKNGDLKPSMVTPGSNKRVWWMCDKGHEWQVSPNQKGKCPYCSNQKALEGFNDLSTTHPEVAKEWHPTKNGDIKPTMVTPGSNKRVWWMCDKGHEWESAIVNRTKDKKPGCPYCLNKMLLKGYNDLATVYPEVSKDWHPTKNGDLKPDNVTYGSGKRVWWICFDCGREYEKRICDKIEHPKCYKCNNIKKEIN